jgi:hypothetical protein
MIGRFGDTRNGTGSSWVLRRGVAPKRLLSSACRAKIMSVSGSSQHLRICGPFLHFTRNCGIYPTCDLIHKAASLNVAFVAVEIPMWSIC